jgi:GGDEF domain-containing protein
MAPEDPVDRSPKELRRRVGELERLLASREEEIEILRFQLATRTTVDDETGLLNRSGLVEAIETAVRRHERLAEGFAVVACAVPEADGSRPGGPETARHVSGLIGAALDDLDRAGRLDDTTFVAVLALLDDAEPLGPVDRLLGVLQAAPLTERDGPAELPRIGVVLPKGQRSPDPSMVLWAVADSLARSRPGRPGTTTI